MMAQIFTNLEETSMYDLNENYSSIDDTPQPIDTEHTFLSNALSKHYEQIIQQKMKFSLGTEVKSQQEVTSLLPDIIPTMSSPEDLKDMYEPGIQEHPDQVVPKSMDENLELPNISPVSDLKSYISYKMADDFFLRDNYIMNQWRSTKLPSDKSEALKKALNCFSQYCSDEKCLKGKYLIDQLVKKIELKNLVDSDDRQILEYLLSHQQDCTEYFCIAPGCSLIEKSSDTLNGLIHLIKNKLSRKLQFSEHAKLYSFSSKCFLKQAQDVREITTYAFTSKYSMSSYSTDFGWSKITLLGEIMQDILPLLIEIGRLSKHRNILAIDWLIDDGNISFASEHYTEPLACRPFCSINKRHIILQLIEAALYLNDNNIAFLAWTSENICWKNGCVKLTNFHMGSTFINSSDSGVIKSLVFPTIIPPELNLDNTTLEKADVWGIGCLLYELLTKKCVHSDLLHMERTEIWKKLDENGWKPHCPFKDYYLQDIFRKAWKVNPRKRMSLDDFRLEIFNYKKEFVISM